MTLVKINWNTENWENDTRMTVHTNRMYRAESDWEMRAMER